MAVSQPSLQQILGSKCSCAGQRGKTPVRTSALGLKA